MTGQGMRSVTAVLDAQGAMRDVAVCVDGREILLAGRGGGDGEVRQVSRLETGPYRLPVLVGSGLGEGLRHLLSIHAGPVAVVDNELDVLEITRIRDLAEDNPNIFWVSARTPRQALKALTDWQMEHGGLSFSPAALPAYLRLDPKFYKTVFDSLRANARCNIWDRLRYEKFSDPQRPRILLLTSTYFLTGELQAACRRAGYGCHLLQFQDREQGCTEFIEDLLKAVLSFRPDFVLTVNHLGVDREGVLTGLLERMRLPLASWFVDNPHLILFLYSRLASDWVTIFTWDEDNVSTLGKLGFTHVHYLPLGTDETRFVPRSSMDQGFAHETAFVGNSMVYKVGARLKAGRFPRSLLLAYRDLASQFARSPAQSVRDFLRREHPEIWPAYEGLEDMERQLAFETLLTWQATLEYRLDCIRALLPADPLIVGDRGWKQLLAGFKSWKWRPEMNYYQELPEFYRRCMINFNCTSMQMKGAVNQRVFDVPAGRGFLLTDYRRQLEGLFDPGKEVVCFREPDEIPELIRFYRTRPDARLAVASRARKRVLAEHTYEHRLSRIVRVMARTYA